MNQHREIALYGGTFDPPTLAHEAIIAHCLDDRRYDEIWVMPSGKRTDKPGMASDEARLDLLRTVKGASFNGDSRLVISDFELGLSRPTETYQTYQALTRAFPENRFWFVYGADSLQSMPSWSRGTWLRRNLAILAVPRAGFELPPESERLRRIALDAVFAADISSSEVRCRIAARQSCERLLTHAVSAEVATAGLYR